MTMPKQKPGKSEQDVGTPDWLLELVKETWGPIVYDPAASDIHHACANYDTLETDGLAQDWADRDRAFNLYDDEADRRLWDGCIWINPPYAKIRPWVEKASQHESCPVVMLVPAAVGSNWWAEHVDGKAEVYFIRPRLTFKGHDQPYPKDCAILVYGAGLPKYRCIRVDQESVSLSQEDASGRFS